MRFLVIIAGLVLMATGAPTKTQADENMNFEVTPSCVFGEDAGTIRPQLLNPRPPLIRANYPLKGYRSVRPHRRSAPLRPEGVWMARTWP
jgi:hypothetical protein